MSGPFFWTVPFPGDFAFLGLFSRIVGNGRHSEAVNLKGHSIRLTALTGFAAKVGGVIHSVSTGSGSDRIKARPQSKMSLLLFKEASRSRRYRSGY